MLQCSKKGGENIYTRRKIYRDGGGENLRRENKKGKT